MVLDKKSYRSKFVGREKEIHEFQEYLENAKRGQGRLVFVEGEVGIGKTRLGTELARISREQDVWFIQGQGLHRERW